MIQGINGLPFINLDSTLDVESLMSLKNKILKSIAVFSMAHIPVVDTESEIESDLIRDMDPIEKEYALKYYRKKPSVGFTLTSSTAHPQLIYFHRWLTNEQIFSNIEFAEFFLLNPYQSVDPTPSTKRHILLIRFDDRQQNYILDKDDAVYHPINCHLSVYNPADYYGIKSYELNSFSIRVEGTFSSKFIKRVPALAGY
jgi:hypothetical protein